MSKSTIDETVCEIIVNLHVFFDDYSKIALWLRLKNLNLGGMSPIDMINAGRSKRLLEFILDASESNGPKALG